MAQTFETYVRWLKAENDAFAAACEGHLMLSVPTCPGWTVLDLLAHHASFQAWITDIINDRLLAPRAPVGVAPPEHALSLIHI